MFLQRPDGVTNGCLNISEYLAWDTTVVHSCAASYIAHTADSADTAVADAEIHFSEKDSGLPTSFCTYRLRNTGPE